MSDKRRALPSVDKLLRSPAIVTLADGAPRNLLVKAVREAIALVREQPAQAPADPDGWAHLVGQRLAAATTPTLRRVINATGVVLHTNLGRAPLASEALEAIARTAAGYATLEYDVATGARGSRHVHCTQLLVELTGAADAMVVNNAASALLLALATAATGGAAIVSRGELIEIGGGFRIPEIMQQSGARLIEVGTTNRTRLADYEKALAAKDARVLLKVHRSNFKLEGFTAEAELGELVALGKKKKVPVLYDLGGGLMTDLSDVGLAGEPTLPESVKAGATAVIASGDKLLGGPQAGILAGTKKFIGACRAHPLARAARADKLTLAALAATLAIYRDPPRVRQAIPALRMLTATPTVLKQRAEALHKVLPAAANAELVDTRAAVGGGAFPGVELDSRGVALKPAGVSASALAQRLRAGSVPVVGVVQSGRLVLDVRTRQDGDDDVIAGAVAEAILG